MFDDNDLENIINILDSESFNTGSVYERKLRAHRRLREFENDTTKISDINSILLKQLEKNSIKLKERSIKQALRAVNTSLDSIFRLSIIEHLQEFIRARITNSKNPSRPYSNDPNEQLDILESWFFPNDLDNSALSSIDLEKFKDTLPSKVELFILKSLREGRSQTEIVTSYNQYLEEYAKQSNSKGLPSLKFYQNTISIYSEYILGMNPNLNQYSTEAKEG